MEEKEGFYEQLEDAIIKVAHNSTLIVAGDFNGHVGRREKGGTSYGRHGYGKTNEDGQRLVEMAERHDLVIMNTMFKKKKNKLVTYYSGGSISQIDYMLTRRSERKKVTDTKVLPFEAVAPQHRPLVIDMNTKMDIKENKKIEIIPKVRWFRLDDKKIRDEYGKKVAEKIWKKADPTDREKTIDQCWNEACKIIVEEAEEILGKSKRKKNSRTES